MGEVLLQQLDALPLKKIRANREVRGLPLFFVAMLLMPGRMEES